MNVIVENFLKTHIAEYGIEKYPTTEAFEHFINRCIVNKYCAERFDPSDIMPGKGEIGIDGIAIIVNEILVTDLSILEEIFNKSKKLDAKFVFIQAKTSESFSGDQIGTFCYGIRNFFLPKEKRLKLNDKIEKLVAIKDQILENIINFDKLPSLELYYACCGKWSDGNNLSERVGHEKDLFESMQNFSNVDFYVYDNARIINLYKELRKKISKKITMEKRITFPVMDGISQSYLGLIKCVDFVSLLKDGDGKLLSNIFEDNVRDFQGYNPVNTEIQATLNNEKDQEKFAILNNGITVLAKNIDFIGDEVELTDYQIVNGCQTSYVLFDNFLNLKNNSYIVVRIVQGESSEVLDRIIYTTNRQTEVKSEAFVSTKHFHKQLEDYYNSIDTEFRLYYERRSKQFELNESINKNKVVTLATQTNCYISMFFNEPHSTHRYYGELLNAYVNKIYLDNDLYDAYYISAYVLFKVESAIKSSLIDKKYKIYKYHILMIIKTIISGKDIVMGNGKPMKEKCRDLMSMIKKNDVLTHINTSCTCLDEAISNSADIVPENMHRNREFSLRLLDIASRFTAAKSNKSYLKKGDIVSCLVTAIKDYYVVVELREEDERNRGSIHISKIAKKFIDDIHDEVRLGDIIQAKIMNQDYFETPHGWNMTMILDYHIH